MSLPPDHVIKYMQIEMEKLAHKQKIEELENDLIEIEKIREQSLKEAYEKGYEEGVKYTDGLISNEKFPF